jgi:hypothetical protein
MIDKKKTRIDMSLEDYEKLVKRIEWTEKLYAEVTSSEYAEYEVDLDLSETDDNKKPCIFKFNVKKFIEDHFDKFYKEGDDSLDYINSKDINFEIITE